MKLISYKSTSHNLQLKQLVMPSSCRFSQMKKLIYTHTLTLFYKYSKYRLKREGHLVLNIMLRVYIVTLKGAVVKKFSYM